MDLDQIPLAWSKRFGLAVSPLFEEQEVADPTSHHVFLDGGQGTFALTTAAEDVWREGHAADWAWSSDIAHHVTVTPTKVAVVKWDRPRDPSILSRDSVDRNLDDFYQFLTADRISSTRSVVYHLLSLFRRIRSLVATAKISDQRSSEIFLLCLARLIFENDLSSPASSWGISSDVSDLYDTLDKKGLSAILTEAKQSEGSFGLLKLHPALAIRHGGGLLFQEAHFDLIRAPSLDFFGYIGAPDVEQVGRGGAHFTPPALARSLVEHALCQFENLDTRSHLRVCDPACGSGVFLHEVLRALRRFNFSGKVVLVGRDISPVAISMAKFVLNCAVRDWTPMGGIELDFQSLDSLEPNAIPRSDLIVMNPPFISWGAQNESQRKQLISIVGKSASSRGDLSMAFVNRAISALSNDGVLGTLFPASLLSQQAAENWRTNLTHTAELRLLGMIGDYGLFTHALVQIGCAVLRKATSEKKADITALVTGDDILATGEALRALRKASVLPPPLPSVGDQWSIFALQSDALEARQTWKLRAPAVYAALHLLEESLSKLGELFDVRQGIQTGNNQALLLNESEWTALPKRERRYFRLATMSDSIKHGRIVRPYYLFFPHKPDGPLFDSERAVKLAVPEYHKRYLAPNKVRLTGRATIRAAQRRDWWGLMRPRSWSFDVGPRIISKYFSGEGGFVVDGAAKYLPSTGFLWAPKSELSAEQADDFPLQKTLYAYAALFNSKTFGRLLQYYAPHVSGGQFDLSPRYVNDLPIPNFSELVSDQARGKIISRLADLSERQSLAEIPRYEDEIDSMIVDIYGPKIIAAL